jgi:predicted NodU family carbamoyl transferase
MNLRVKRREAFRRLRHAFRSRTPRAISNSTRRARTCCGSAVRPQWRARIAAITHVDGTARPQTVSPQDNPHLHRLLRAFERVAGIPVLLNTSFNVAGEPLVENAGRCAARLRAQRHRRAVDRRPAARETVMRALGWNVPRTCQPNCAMRRPM